MIVRDRFGVPLEAHAVVCTDPLGSQAVVVSVGPDVCVVRWVMTGIDEEVDTGTLMVVPTKNISPIALRRAEEAIGTEAHQLAESASNPFAGRIDQLRGYGVAWSGARKKIFESTQEPCTICVKDTPEMQRRRNNELSMSLQRDAEQLGWTTRRRSDTYFQAHREEKDDDGVLISEHLGIMVRDDGIDVADIREHAATPATVAMMFRRPL